VAVPATTTPDVVVRVVDVDSVAEIVANSSRSIIADSTGSVISNPTWPIVSNPSRTVVPNSAGAIITDTTRTVVTDVSWKFVGTSRLVPQAWLARIESRSRTRPHTRPLAHTEIATPDTSRPVAGK
jgi:hypothetical protein